ncbi:hypothetical protein [Maricaulis sp.]|uniref:hypothetical protein n=1 Tax=Maricaulis sp. TaxID=1486257 RepID=UPI0026144AE0|nr:hypothetical protein [Maricaulis sp.]
MTSVGDITNQETGWAIERVRELVAETEATHIPVDSSRLDNSLSRNKVENIAEDFMLAMDQPITLAYVPSQISRTWDLSTTWPVFEAGNLRIKVLKDRAAALDWLREHAGVTEDDS